MVLSRLPLQVVICWPRFCNPLKLNIIYATIEENTIYTNAQQAITCLIVCQMLSNYYCDIRLFRFDDKTGDIYILASEDIQIIVPSHEPWRFVDETEL
ncbi:DUF6888 family protein [Halotia branconii]|uniref:DUF6888 family protein n=1 Tax=Halotia branconii TaxID=1620816 RepID=UPI003CCFB6DF